VVLETTSDGQELYHDLLEAGVAREQARMVLPLATTTKIHMTGSIRSWIHFLELRDDGHAQKEIQLIAKEIKHIFIQEFPIISKALGYE
jgi:thymidylate synthase (FAD)